MTEKSPVSAKKDTRARDEKRTRGKENRLSPAPPRLIGAFLERGKAAVFTRRLAAHGVFFTTVMSGKGTAGSEILDILGLEDSEKDVVIALADFPRARAVMAALNDRLSGMGLGKGIAFCVPLSAAPNLLVRAFAIRAGKQSVSSEVKTMPGDIATENSADKNIFSDKGNKFSLILISVNQGYADEVMSVAKSAGARGGTLVRAHQTASDGAVGLFGSAFSVEREVIAVLTTLDKRNAILEAVNSSHGMRSDAGAVAIALPVDDVAKLS